VVSKNGDASANAIQNQEQIDKASKPTAPVSAPLNLPPMQRSAPAPAKK